MPSPRLATIRRHCLPMGPVETDVQPVVRPLPGIKCVLFDIYGTLFVSDSGDVGTAATGEREQALSDALRAVGLRLQRATLEDDCNGGRRAGDHLIAAIRDAHQSSRKQGIEYPEVDIVAIWKDTLQRLGQSKLLAAPAEHVDFYELALEYEMRTNPTWPMPGVRECLRRLVHRGSRLGMISNAQFFTQQLFPALLDQPADALGFESCLQFYSYQWGRAKPGLFLYQRAVEALSRIKIDAHDVLYVGNDMLNDVTPAWNVGFRTALFAGDARSLRLRRGDPRVAGIEPDVVITELSQLDGCIE
ncbi:MAG: HAD family hydrolase [Planctomycetota bacterium]